MNRKIFILLSFFTVFISLFDIKLIPFYHRLGLDFSNHYGFHHCNLSDQDTIYKIDTNKCSDFENRKYVYPPFMFQLYNWTTWFNSVDGAYYFYLLIHLISFFIIVLIWSEKDKLTILFGLSLYISYPNVFLMERGNSDLLIVLFWSLSYLSFKKMKYFLTGFFLAISIFAKLYPLYSLIVVFPLILCNAKYFKKISLSLVFFSTCILLLSPVLWFEYLFEILPGWSSLVMPPNILAHSLKSLPYFFNAKIIFGIILLSWLLASYKSGVRRENWIWGGALAISTFNNGVSFDYNLVTMFPLFILGFKHFSLHSKSSQSFTYVALLLVVLGSRYFFQLFDFYPILRLYSFGLLLTVIPISIFDLGFEMKRYSNKLKFISLS